MGLQKNIFVLFCTIILISSCTKENVFESGAFDAPVVTIGSTSDDVIKKYITEKHWEFKIFADNSFDASQRSFYRVVFYEDGTFRYSQCTSTSSSSCTSKPNIVGTWELKKGTMYLSKYANGEKDTIYNVKLAQSGYNQDLSMKFKKNGIEAFFRADADEKIGYPAVDENLTLVGIKNTLGQSNIDLLEKMGFTINKGFNPPHVNKNYRSYSVKILNTNRLNENVGDPLKTHTFRFKNFNFFSQGVDIDINMTDFSIPSTRSAIFGDGNKFTTYTYYKAGYGTYAYLISGEMSGTTMKNVKACRIVVDDGGYNLAAGPTGAILIAELSNVTTF